MPHRLNRKKYHDADKQILSIVKQFVELDTISSLQALSEVLGGIGHNLQITLNNLS